MLDGVELWPMAMLHCQDWVIYNWALQLSGCLLTPRACEYSRLPCECQGPGGSVGENPSPFTPGLVYGKANGLALNQPHLPVTLRQIFMVSISKASAFSLLMVWEWADKGEVWVWGGEVLHITAYLAANATVLRPGGGVVKTWFWAEQPSSCCMVEGCA